MKRLRLDARFPNLVIFAGGMTLLGLITTDFVRQASQLPDLAHVAVWIGLMTMAGFFPVPRRGRGAPAKLSCAFEFAAVLVFGAPIACWLAVVSRLLANGRAAWTTRTLGDLGRAVAALVASERMYVALGGPLIASFTPSAEMLLALLGAAFTFLMVFEGLPFLAGFLGLRQPTRVRLEALRDALIWQAPLLPFGVPTAVVDVNLGAAGLVLLGLPLLIAARARSVWTRARRGHVEAVRTLMTALDAGDPFTRGHSYRIAKMSVRVGQHLGLDTHTLEELEYAAILHDVGRTAVKDEHQPRNPSLSPQQQSILRHHPSVGGDIVARFGFYPGAVDVVHAHHEQPDGEGYPHGLAGKDIPLGSLIIMVVAAFDAMTSDRPYRRGLSGQIAIEELRAHAGTQFSVPVVEALATLHGDGTLYDRFSTEVLEAYARGEGNSRAIYEHLQRSGIPVVAGAAHHDVLIGADEVPELELPPGSALGEKQPIADERTLPIAPDGTTLDAAAQTDVGCVRDNNEDSYGIFEHATGTGCLLVVADGMGGAAAGEVASRLAVETVRGVFLDDAPPKDPAESLRLAIAAANEAIRERASSDDDLYGMGTTCVAAWVADKRMYVGHVGDSRAYMVSPSGIRQITRDHNLAEELKCVVGAVGPEGAQHVLTRSLGSRPGVEVDVSAPLVLREHQAVVLCSDGLSNLVEAEEIRDIVREHDPVTACEVLVDMARERGAPDNVTVQVARVRVG